jgi:hypothetical protein
MEVRSRELVDGEKDSRGRNRGDDYWTKSLVEATEEGKVSVCWRLEAGFDSVEWIDKEVNGEGCYSSGLEIMLVVQDATLWGAWLYNEDVCVVNL